MHFENFELAESFGGIALRGLGHAWDLHNFADFRGFTFHPERDELTLEWSFPAGEANQWGSRGNDATGCRLLFKGLRFLRVTARDDEYPRKESRTVSELSKVVPEPGEFRCKTKWEQDEPFHLLILFQDEREIEIDADVARLEAIT